MRQKIGGLDFPVLDEELAGKRKPTDQELKAAQLTRKAREARLLFDVPGYEEAAPLLKEAVELAPGYAPAYAELAETYAYWAFRREICGQESDSLYELASACAEQAVKLGPDLPEAWRSLAVALRRGRFADPERRAQAAVKALELAPADPECLLEKWRVDGYDPDDAEIQKVLELNPGFVAAHIDRGAVFCELERYTEALAELEKAVELNPKNAQAYYDIAMVFDRMGLRPRAKVLIEKALRVRPGEPLLLQGLAYLEQPEEAPR